MTPGKRWLFKSAIGAAVVILVALALPYLLLNTERRKLDDAVRIAAGGRFAALPDGAVHYELAGPPGGRPVVFIHGISVPAYIWDGTFESLGAAGFRVLRYDLYGRGYSDRPAASYDRALFVRQLAGLLDAAGLSGPVDLVGVSMGGGIAANFADSYPARVRRLVLMDPAPSSPPSAMVRVLSAPILGDYLFATFGSVFLTSDQKSDFYNPASMPPKYIERFKEQMTYRGFTRAILSTVRNLYAPGYMDVFARVGKRGLPVLLIWGRQDTSVPFANSRNLHSLMPSAEFHAIDGAGHLPHIEKPAEFLALAKEFLGR